MVPYFILVLLLHSVLVAILRCDMTVTHEWRSVDYVWPSQNARDSAIRAGKYDPKSVAILDVDVWDPSSRDANDRGHNIHSKRIFLTTPKFQAGVPVSLSTVSSRLATDGSHLLDPFPDWASHKEGNCDGLTSVYRVQIDECGKLWVLDTGKLDTFTANPRKICKPQIVVYDLKKKDKIVARHRFPDSIILDSSLPVTIVIDTRDRQCNIQYAYIADVSGFKMLVYDSFAKQSWRIISNFFFPNPSYGTFNLNGVSFDLMDGIFGIAIGPLTNNDRRVYFHALASVKEGWTMSSTLLNATNFKDNLTPTNLFQMSQFERNSPSTSEVMSEDGIMFFPLINTNSLACWNSRTVYKGDNFVTLYKNDQTFQFVSGLKLINNKHLYALTSRLQNYIVGQVDLNQVSYRILTSSISDLTRRTQCDVARSDNYEHSHSSVSHPVYNGDPNVNKPINHPGTTNSGGYGLHNVNNHPSAFPSAPLSFPTPNSNAPQSSYTSHRATIGQMENKRDEQKNDTNSDKEDVIVFPS